MEALLTVEVLPTAEILPTLILLTAEIMPTLILLTAEAPEKVLRSCFWVIVRYSPEISKKAGVERVQLLEKVF